MIKNIKLENIASWQSIVWPVFNEKIINPAMTATFIKYNLLLSHLGLNKTCYLFRENFLPIL